jgi:hypothetical protein
MGWDGMGWDGMGNQSVGKKNAPGISFRGILVFAFAYLGWLISLRLGRHHRQVRLCRRSP